MTRLSTPPTLPRLAVIKTRDAFLRAARGKRAATRSLVLQWLEAETAVPEIQVGFTASRKVGGAVVRNRARRRLREAARAVLPASGRPGGLYVLIARGETATVLYARLVSDLAQAVDRVHKGGDGPGRRRSRRPSERASKPKVAQPVKEDG